MYVMSPNIQDGGQEGDYTQIHNVHNLSKSHGNISPVFGIIVLLLLVYNTSGLSE